MIPIPIPDTTFKAFAMSCDQDELILHFVLKNNYQSEEDAAPDMKDAYTVNISFHSLLFLERTYKN